MRGWPLVGANVPVDDPASMLSIRGASGSILKTEKAFYLTNTPGSQLDQVYS